MTVRELLSNDAIDRHLMVVVYERNDEGKFERQCAYSRNRFDSAEEQLLKKYGNSSVMEYDIRRHCVMVYLDD